MSGLEGFPARPGQQPAIWIIGANGIGSWFEIPQSTGGVRLIPSNVDGVLSWVSITGATYATPVGFGNAFGNSFGQD